MFSFLKKIFGLPTDDEVKAAQAAKEVPYKVESQLVVNTKSGDLVDVPAVKVAETVESQITDAVTQVAEPVKKTRKPRAPKAEKPVKEKVVKEKAAKARKPAAEKKTRSSKKA